MDDDDDDDCYEVFDEDDEPVSEDEVPKDDIVVLSKAETEALAKLNELRGLT